VTRLRKMMLEELQRRNFSQHTIRYYIRTVEDFARHFNRAPDRLGLRHIREYQAELFQKRKVSPGTVANRLAALRFFYIKTLKVQSNSELSQERSLSASGCVVGASEVIANGVWRVLTAQFSRPRVHAAYMSNCFFCARP
jgi:integrase-like protein